MTIRGTIMLSFAITTLHACLGQGLHPKPVETANSNLVLPNGEFIGLQKMENASPEHPGAKWFHENTLVIREANAILDQQPVVFWKGKKEYSASDGGFRIYRGRVATRDGRDSISLRLFDSDYIAFPQGPHECEPYSRISIFSVKRIDKETFEIDGLRYKRSSVERARLAFLLHQLTTEPFAYTGDHPYRKDSHAPPCESPQ